MFTKLFNTALFIIISCNAFSQDYRITQTLPIDDSKTFVTLSYGRGEFGFGYVNPKGVLESQMNIDGYPFAVAKTGAKNIIVFYSEKHKSTSPLKIIHAILIESGKKRIIKDNVIFTNPGRNELDPVIIRDRAGNYISMLIRITDYSPSMGGFGGNSDVKMKKTNALINVTTDKNLNPTETKLETAASSGDFMEACGAAKGMFYICSYADDRINTEQFDSLGKLQSKLSVDLPIRKKSRTEQVFQSDSTSPNCVNLAVAYADEKKDDYLQLFKFDFNAKKVSATEKVSQNKDYVRALKFDTDNSKIKNFGNIENLTPVQIIETVDKIIVVKEIQSETLDKNVVTQQRGGAIISVYSKELKLLNETAIDKWCAFNIYSFAAVHAFPKAGKLNIIADEMKGLASYRAILYTMDIDGGNIVNKGEIEKEESGSNWICIPSTVMWFSNSFVVPFLSAKSFITFSVETSMVSEKYR